MSGRCNQSGHPLPANEWTLCLYATFLAQSLRYSSIKVYFSAVRSLHIDYGLPDPMVDCLQLQRVLRGIKRTQGLSTHSNRLPVTRDVMHLVCSSLDHSNADDAMFWAACTLAYFGFLRSAEFTVPSVSAFNPEIHLNLNDVAVDSHTNPSCLRVMIKVSKTDPFRQGCPIFIGKGNPPLCAVDAMVQYFARRGDKPGPLFYFADGQPLTRNLVTKGLRDILQAANIPGNYSSHSFRIGAATMAARGGIPDHLIQMLGRWRSDAYKRYIQTPRDILASTAKNLSVMG